MPNIRPIVIKEIRHIVRDVPTLIILLVLPLFLLVMFGYAINLDVKRIGLAVYDGDKSEISRNFIEDFTHTEYFVLKRSLDAPEEIDELLLDESVQVMLVIPPDFGKKLLQKNTAPLQVIIDGSNPTVGSTAVGYIEMIVADYTSSAEYFSASAGSAQLNKIPVESLPRIWFNPELLSARFLVPGLIAFILMVTAVISTSLSIVREKERGTVEQLVVSPIRPYELLIGKTIPYFFIALINASCVLLASYLFFGMAIQGSYFIFLIVTLTFLIGCLGLGILISTFIDTQQNAFLVAVFLTVLPSYILSGFVFPIRNMPLLIQAVTYVVPNRYFLSALRSIMIKGVGIESFLFDFIALCIFDVVVISLSILRLRGLKRL
jgi:ABC-2 type transport system permease protein